MTGNESFVDKQLKIAETLYISLIVTISILNAILAVITNIVMLRTLKQWRDLKQGSKMLLYFMFSAGIADALATVLLVAILLYILHKSDKQEGVQFVEAFAKVTVNSMTVLSVICVAVDRCTAIRTKVTQLSTALAKTIIVIMVVLASINGVRSAVVLFTIEDSEEFDTVTNIFTIYVIPVITITALYTFLCVKIWQQIRKDTEMGICNIGIKRLKRVSRMCIEMATLFFILWSPYYLYKMVKVLWSHVDETTDEVLSPLFTLIGKMYGTLQPLVYIRSNKTLRERYLKEARKMVPTFHAVKRSIIHLFRWDRLRQRSTVAAIDGSTMSYALENGVAQTVPNVQAKATSISVQPHAQTTIRP